MQVSKTTQSSTALQLTIIATPSELEAAKDAAVQRLGAGVKVPGFRAGKAPAAIIEKQLDPSALQTEVVEAAVNNLYFAAITKEKLRPVVNPTIAVIKYVPYTTLEFTADVQVVGDVTVADYTKIHLEKPEVSVTDADIMAVLNDVAAKNATKKEVDRAAVDGDEVWIDFAGTDAKGEPVAGADGKDYPLILGSNTFIKGFEPALLGLKAGDQKTFTVTFPKDYGVAALQGKKVTFAVTVNKVEERTVPELNDAFAASLGPIKTMDALKQEISRELLQQKQYDAEMAFSDEVLRAVTAKSKVDLPEALVAEQIQDMMTELQRNLTYRGLTLKEYLAQNDLTEETHRDTIVRPGAEERLKAGMVLEAVAEAQKIAVDENDVEARLAAYKAQYSSDAKMQAELDSAGGRREIRARLLTERTVAHLVDTVTAKKAKKSEK